MEALMQPAPHAAKPIEAGPIPRKTYYPRFPAWDGLLDVLHSHGLPASSINLAEASGRYHLSILLPGHRFTDEYEGADLQAVAQRWLNAETAEDENGSVVILSLVGVAYTKQTA